MEGLVNVLFSGATLCTEFFTVLQLGFPNKFNKLAAARLPSSEFRSSSGSQIQLGIGFRTLV
jgi:hypothetical protein